MNFSRKTKQSDFSLILLLILLMIFGVIMIFSASTTKIGESFEYENYYIKQAVFLIISLIALMVILYLPYSLLEALVIPFYALSIILLLIVLFVPAVKGSHRWLNLGPVGFQPSEFAKLMSILMIAKLLDKQHLSNLAIITRTALVIILPFVLIFIEPDLGTAMTLLMTALAILAFSDIPFYYIVIIISFFLSITLSVNSYAFITWIIFLILYFLRNKVHLLIAGLTVILNASTYFLVPFVWNNLKVYQQNRILTFLNPFHDPFGAGYQIIQAKIAIGSGAWFGKGFLLGTQKNLHFLPEHHTDFIFSVIGEELGFFGCFIFLTFYFLFLYRLVANAAKLKRKFMFYASAGITANIALMFFVNIGMNMGLVPATGIPLPFIAYGGSNLLINTLAVGLILKFASEKNVFD